jgi:cytochrome b involved in lipid metabolism
MFDDNDYNKILINMKKINQHNFDDSAWIIINKYVYSISKTDKELLILFENYYGKDATDYVKNNLSNKNKILLFDKLKHRIIGKI